MGIVLRQPLKNAEITQKFGKDFWWYNPVKGISEWFYKGTYGLFGHTGLDYRANVGTPVYAMHDGVILYAGYDETNGNLVQIWNELEGYKTMYGHNSEFKVKTGDIVKAGQLISLSGGTGAGTGPHLHIGLKMTGWGGNGINNDNGYNGAIDPLPFIKLDYLGKNLINKDMVLKKEKGKSDIWLIIESNKTKINLTDMPTFAAMNEDFEEVTSLAGYMEYGSLIWLDRKIN